MLHKVFLISMILSTVVTVFVLWESHLCLYYGLISPILTFVFLYAILPIIFMANSSIQRLLIYLPRAKVRSNINYADTEAEGLVGSRHFFLHPEDGHFIGIWHLLPLSIINNLQAMELLSKNNADKEKIWNSSLREYDKHVVIYFHGNTGTRATDHRKEFYWILQNLDCHVIAFDYRGFGDSSEVKITEESTVRDGICVYKWVRRTLGPFSNAQIYIWGHSLGTGICTHTSSKLCIEGDPPGALILESPFTNIGDAFKYHWRAKMYRHLPFFNWIFVRSLKKNGISYESEKHIHSVDVPVLILHAEDDETIPIELGKKLHAVAANFREKDAYPILFKTFGPGHGHKFICRSPELPILIGDFIRSTIVNEWSDVNVDKC